MVRSRTQSMLVRRVGKSADELGDSESDDLIVEEPLTVYLDGAMVSSTMRTPGHDFELAAGFLQTEGYLEPGMVTEIHHGDANTVRVETGGKAPAVTARLGSTTSSCGLCGSETIDSMTAKLQVLETHEPWDLQLLARMPELLRAEQPLFDATGAVHAAAAVGRDGNPILTREDIGRHNAVDKIIGRMLLDEQLPARDLAIVVSSRASFEMVQKAWSAGFTALVAVSAPSALAVETAHRAGMTVLGFARNGQAKLYT